MTETQETALMFAALQFKDEIPDGDLDSFVAGYVTACEDIELTREQLFATIEASKQKFKTQHLQRNQNANEGSSLR